MTPMRQGMPEMALDLRRVYEAFLEICRSGKCLSERRLGLP